MKTLKLLLVEDSDDDAQLLLRVLKDGGYDVTYERVDTKPSLQSALEKTTWDVIISDYNMPMFNALEALLVLEQSGLDLPFIVVSGAIGEETAVETMRAGANDYLMKGKLQRLIPAIDREIREAKMRAQRTEAELALYASEEKFRFIFEHTPVPMWIVDKADGCLIEVNEAAVSTYGYTRREFLQMKLADLLVPDTTTKTSLASSHRMVGEAIHRKKSGEQIEVEVHSDDLKFQDKKLMVFISQDITRRKQTERELIRARETALEASALKSEFLANVSHEIRTPLNGIIGVTDFLARSPITKKEKEWVNIIRMSGDALLSIVNQVLDFSKIESGKLEFEKINFNLGELLQETANIFSYAAKNKKLTLKVSCPQELHRDVEGDPARIRQILVNLLDNAIKFTHEGHIAVMAEKVSEDDQNLSLKISVQDTGIGIQDQSRGRLFHPFSQVDSSSTRRYGGTGLGLAICQKLVNLMGGEIDYESASDKGSTFWFQLNLKKNSKVQPAAELNKTTDSPKKPDLDILVVEDSPVNKKVMIEMVRKIGYRAHGVADGEEAVRALENKFYNAILMDCQMPVVNGYEATARIRQQETSTGRRTPIIAVTAHAMKGDREKCLDAGMDDYLAKPIDVQTLASTLHKWLTKSI